MSQYVGGHIDDREYRFFLLPRFGEIRKISIEVRKNIPYLALEPSMYEGDLRQQLSCSQHTSLRLYLVHPFSPTGHQRFEGGRGLDRALREHLYVDLYDTGQPVRLPPTTPVLQRE